MAGRGKPKMTDEQRITAIGMLARFVGPIEVHKEIKTIWPDLDIAWQTIQRLDPTKPTGHDLAQKWKTLFFKFREEYRSAAVEIPVANQVYRLQRLQKIVDRTGEQGNVMAEMSALEQAAKECGDSYTNRRQLTGAGGAPLVPQAPPTSKELVAAVHEIGEMFLGKRK